MQCAMGRDQLWPRGPYRHIQVLGRCETSFKHDKDKRLRAFLSFPLFYAFPREYAYNVRVKLASVL
jgi:hypothetical protein